jgi:hypothetical protein
LDGAVWTITTELNHTFADLYDGLHALRVQTYDLAGNHDESAITFTVDTCTPAVLSKTPVGTGNLLNSTITVGFSEAMNHSATIITVNGIAGTLYWDGNLATIGPISALSYNEEYEVSMVGFDLAGNKVSLSWSFSTRSVGNIEGVLIDENGNAISDAVVRLSNGLMTTSDGSGHFYLNHIELGSYNITIFKDGYKELNSSVSVEKGTLKDMGWLEMIEKKGDGSSGSDETILIVTAVAMLGFIAAGTVFFLKRKP